MATLAVGGCKDATGGDGDGDLGERLTRAAYERACDEARDFLVGQYSGSYFVQALCTALAVEGNTDAQECGADLDDCINNPPPEIQAGIDAILAQAGCGAFSINPSDCDTTLGALEACLGALESEVSSIQYTLTCAAAGETLDGWDIVSFPSECSSLEADCQPDPPGEDAGPGDDAGAL